MAVNQGNKEVAKIFFFWLPVAAWMAVIFCFSSQPGRDIPKLFPYQDIVFHLFSYSILAYFFVRALKNTQPGILFSKAILFTVIFGVLYGFSDEFHQLFVPNRCCSGFDVFIDGVGSFFGSLFYRW